MEFENYEYLYIMQNGIREEYKIGRTKNLERRHGQLQTGCPHELRIIKVWQHYNHSTIVDYETTIHRFYKHKKIRENGEWFMLTKTEVNELCSPNSIAEQDLLIEEFKDLI